MKFISWNVNGLRACAGKGETGIGGNGAIVEHGVVVGDKEGAARLIVKDVALHCRPLFLTDIRGIAHDEVELRSER